MPVPSGGFVRRVAHTPHYDGAKRGGKEPAVIGIFGEAPIALKLVDPSKPPVQRCRTISPKARRRPPSISNRPLRATMLAPVYGWFTEGHDTRDLKDAKALLEELAVSPPRGDGAIAQY